MTTIANSRGGAWLVEDVAPGAIFTVEKFSDEHRLIARTADDFMRHEVAPALERLEQKDWSLARTLLQRCGALGLIGTDVPEAYGGVEVDKVSSIIVGEAVGMVASFATTFGAQSGLSITPLLCFGTDDQKARYLPRLVTGELIGAYALSESGSGSDALGAKTRASRRADGSYLLTGEKMWISNGGFADLFIVFAKVDGEHFSAFLVERSFPGVSTGKEEHKMGLHGSSTTPLILQEAVVPAGQLLGEIGKGQSLVDALHLADRIGLQLLKGQFVIMSQRDQVALFKKRVVHRSVLPEDPLVQLLRRWPTLQAVQREVDGQHLSGR